MAWRDAFLYFGGVPQELLFDQMKAVITRDLPLEGGALVRNAEFLRFALLQGRCLESDLSDCP